MEIQSRKSYVASSATAGGLAYQLFSTVDGIQYCAVCAGRFIPGNGRHKCFRCGVEVHIQCLEAPVYAFCFSCVEED